MNIYYVTEEIIASSRRRLGEFSDKVINTIFDSNLWRGNSRKISVENVSRMLITCKLPAQNLTLSSIYLTVAIFGEATLEPLEW